MDKCNCTSEAELKSLREDISNLQRRFKEQLDINYIIHEQFNLINDEVEQLKQKMITIVKEGLISDEIGDNSIQ